MLALQAGLLAPVVEAYLRLAGFKRCRWLLQRLGRTGQRRQPPRPTLEQVQRMAIVIDSGYLRYAPFSPACLCRSLVMQLLLALRGTDVRLRLGAGTEGGVFRAHAWLEYEGVILGHLRDPGFECLPFEDSDKIAH